MSTALSRYHHGDLPAALLRAALEVLDEQGISGLTLREVARRAGVSAMAPYRHYCDKDALLAAVATHGFRTLTAALREAPRRNAAEGLMVQGVAYVCFAREHPQLFRLMFGPFRRCLEDHPELKTAADAARTALNDAVAAALPEGDLQTRSDVALACWSLCHGLASLLVDGRLDEGSEKEASERLARRLLRVLEIGALPACARAAAAGPALVVSPP